MTICKFLLWTYSPRCLCEFSFFLDFCVYLFRITATFLLVFRYFPIVCLYIVVFFFSARLSCFSLSWVVANVLLNFHIVFSWSLKTTLLLSSSVLLMAAPCCVTLNPFPTFYRCQYQLFSEFFLFGFRFAYLTCLFVAYYPFHAPTSLATAFLISQFGNQPLLYFEIFD
jgi:hypothetical protein